MELTRDALRQKNPTHTPIFKKVYEFWENTRKKKCSSVNFENYSLFSLLQHSQCCRIELRGGGETSPGNLQFQMLMKRTMVALLALGVSASAENVTLSPGTTTVTGVSGGKIDENRPFETANDYTKADLKSIIDVISDPTVPGWYVGVGQGANNASDLTLTTTGSTVTGFTFKARHRLSHEYVLALVSAPENVTTTALTMSFTPTANIAVSVWCFDKETESITLLQDRTQANKNVAATVTVDQLSLNDHQMFVFAWSSAAVTDALTGGADITVKNIALNATTSATPSVPEPATATLSLMALAGLAARRRRK